MRAIITGTSLLDSGLFGDMEQVRSEYGEAGIARKNNTILLNRHHGGKPPHAIDWRANIAALKKLGVDEAIGVGSAGSLKENIKPGAFFVPLDYIDFSPVTIFEGEIKHVVPALDDGLRKEIIGVLERLGLEWKEGVYWQSKGPRFETKAEVHAIKDYADVVGMTMASEATLCSELGIRYAALCTVDNYANGIGETPSYEAIRGLARKNMETTESVVNELINQKR